MLEALVARFTADLDPRAVVEWTRDGGLAEARLLVGGTFVAGGGVPADAPPEQGAAWLVGLFQDALIEAACGAPLPPCPVAGHPHPAVVRPAAGGLGWRCPRADGDVAH